MSRLASSIDTDLPLLLDTHVLVWLVFGEPMLGSRTKSTIARASLEGRLLISAITPWEIGVLVSKGRIDLRRDALAWVRSALELPGVRFAELSPEISVESTRLPWEMHGDPADRILAATARHLGAVLVTADQKLLRDAGKKHFHAMNARA
jgi:PIN domain nuclease of toxin-antitoxin system